LPVGSVENGAMSEFSSSFTIPDELPVLPLREMVVFPYMVLPLFVARERSIAAVEDALAGDRLLLLVAQREGDIEAPEPDDLYRVGTVAMVMRILRMGDGRVKVLVQGLAKARIDRFVEHERASWVSVSAVPADEEAGWCVEAEALIRTVRGRVEELLPLKNLPPEVLSVTANVQEVGRLADLVASNLRLRITEAQELLEIVDPLARLRRVDALLRRELEVTSVQAEIQSQAQDEMNRGQREAYLREQLRAIQVELGETDPRLEEAEEYRVKIEEVGMPEQALAEATRQVKRLERMHPDGPEAHVLRSYLDWMVELPWSNESPDCLDLANAKAILDEDHAHLSGIKDRILEYLGVRKLRGDSRGPILCFAGPPGVGKTSLGRSIARAMGREFVRISLGGVRDEAEIRGHRRTYVGALPGRIIQGLKQAGICNPVFMLDEIDKLGADFRGDPSSALLEVLDPLQRPLPECPLRSLARALHHHGEHAGLDPQPAARPHGGDSHLGLHARGEGRDRAFVPHPQPDEGARAARGPYPLVRRRRAADRDGLHARGGRAEPRTAGRRRLPQDRAPRRRGRRDEHRREPPHRGAFSGPSALPR